MSTQGPATQVNYRLKYKLLKRCIKDIVLENSALCDRAADIQHQIVVAQEERKFLWKKFVSTQGNNFTEELFTNTGGIGQQPEPKKTPARKTSNQKNVGTQPKSRKTSKTKLKQKKLENKNNSNEEQEIGQLKN